MQTLQQVLDEQGQRMARGDVIASPHELELRYSSKGGAGWLGYKLQVTETAGQTVRFVTDIAVTSALVQDNVALDDLQARLAQHQLSPPKQYVDTDYC